LFLLEKVCDSYFYYNWIQLFLVQLKSLTRSTVNSIDWMVCSINWTMTAKLFLKLIWVFKGMRIITFRIIKTKTFKKHSLRFSKREIAPFVRSSFWQSFSNQETSKNVNLWSILWVRFLRLWFWTKAKSSTPDLHSL